MLISRMIQLSRTNPDILLLSARWHSVIAGRRAQEVSDTLTASDWTCSECGVKMPQALEFAGGHASDDPLRAICQFCHNMHHPVWAATRGRITPILIPQGARLRQADISRMSWALLAASHQVPAVVQDRGRGAQRLLTEFEDCADAFMDRFGATAEAFLEAMIMSVDTLPETAIADLDAHIRFIPSILLPEAGADTSIAGRISMWTGHSFEDVTQIAIDAWVEGQNPAMADTDRERAIQREALRRRTA